MWVTGRLNEGAAAAQVQTCRCVSVLGACGALLRGPNVGRESRRSLLALITLQSFPCVWSKPCPSQALMSH